MTKMGTVGLKAAKGTDCTPVKIGGLTTLLGDPEIRIEKPYTIVQFPGGSVEISRCSNGSYWVHVATAQDLPSDPIAKITDARIDAVGRYCDAGNEALAKEIEQGGVNHIAFLIGPQPKV